MIKRVKYLVKFSNPSIIIQTNHIATLNIMHYLFITFISFTMRTNVCLVRASQFLYKFCLILRHKSKKEHIISNTLSKFVNANDLGHTLFYLELDALFIYYITLIKIHLDLVSYILKSYAIDNW